MVLAASIPGRCAAPPAPAMITFIPRVSAVSAYSNNQSGVLCAETTLSSLLTSSWFNMSTDFFSVGKSEVLPPTIPTNGLISSVVFSGITTSLRRKFQNIIITRKQFKFHS